MEDRVIPLHGIHNLRDYGAYATRDGAKLKSGLLWRSGQHVDATPDDLAAIDRLKLATIFDLRTDGERIDYPCARHPAFAARVIFASSGPTDTSHAPHVEAAGAVQTAAEAHDRMVEVYKFMPFRPYLVEAYRLYFATLAERPGANLLHCLAGKDRTGLAAALLHALLGVHPDEMMADYLLTNVAGNVDRRIAAGASAVRGSFGPTMDEAAVRTLMSVHQDYLNAAFASICEKHGRIEAYAQDLLGVTPEVRTKLEAKLLD
jgi:protein-tyrosine phosphatase